MNDANIQNEVEISVNVPDVSSKEVESTKAIAGDENCDKDVSGSEFADLLADQELSDDDEEVSAGNRVGLVKQESEEVHEEVIDVDEELRKSLLEDQELSEDEE